MVAVGASVPRIVLRVPATRNLPPHRYSNCIFILAFYLISLIFLLILKTWSSSRLPFVILPPPLTMSPTLDGSPFVLPTIPDMALLAIGQYDWYQPDPAGCNQSPDSSHSLPFSSPLSEPEAQSPAMTDGSAGLSPPGPELSKSRPKSSGAIRQKRNIDSLSPATYPYTRPEAKKDVDGVKRRKVWDHMLERRLFSPEEL